MRTDLRAHVVHDAVAREGMVPRGHIAEAAGHDGSAAVRAGTSRSARESASIGPICRGRDHGGVYEPVSVAVPSECAMNADSTAVSDEVAVNPGSVATSIA